MYYKVYNTTTHKIEYWRGDPANAGFLLTTGNFIIPTGTHKPRNVSRETIKQF